MSHSHASAGVADASELESRLRFETFFADLTRHFLTLPARSLPREIDRGAGRAGRDPRGGPLWAGTVLARQAFAGHATQPCESRDPGPARSRPRAAASLVDRAAAPESRPEVQPGLGRATAGGRGRAPVRGRLRPGLAHGVAVGRRGADARHPRRRELLAGAAVVRGVPRTARAAGERLRPRAVPPGCRGADHAGGGTQPRHPRRAAERGAGARWGRAHRLDERGGPALLGGRVASRRRGLGLPRGAGQHGGGPRRGRLARRARAREPAVRGDVHARRSRWRAPRAATRGPARAPAGHGRGAHRRHRARAHQGPVAAEPRSRRGAQGPAGGGERAAAPRGAPRPRLRDPGRPLGRPRPHAEPDRAGGPDRLARAAAGRDRHRQGPGRPRAARPQPQARAAHRHRQLRSAARHADRERAVRLREGRLHRRAAALRRPLRDRRRGHPVPRRDRRVAARGPGQAAACPAERRVRAARLVPHAEDQRAPDRGHQPRPRAGDA